MTLLVVLVSLFCASIILLLTGFVLFAAFSDVILSWLRKKMQ